MFTGIITKIGKVSNRTDNTLTINTDSAFLAKLKKGVSVSVNGICLTVIKKLQGSFTIDFMPETFKKTNIKFLQINDLVNLELPATPNSCLSGHIIQGHIDGISRLLDIQVSATSRILKLSVPAPFFTKYMTDKGSISLNGISLTIIAVGKNYFTVGIIPYTWNHTMLQSAKVGDYLNIETDILAKYLEKFTTLRHPEGVKRPKDLPG